MEDMTWEGIRHWKTWALAALDICISTTKCRPLPHFTRHVIACTVSSLPNTSPLL